MVFRYLRTFGFGHSVSLFFLKGLRVAPPDPRPSGRESRQEFDFLGRESTPEAKKGEKGPRVGRSGRELA